MPQAVGRNRPWRDHRQVVEGIVFRYRTGVAWRDLPGRFGPWQTVWKRHHRFATDGTCDKLLRVIQAEADAAGRVDWNVSVDSSIVRAHQHSATAKRMPGRIAPCSSSPQGRCRMTRIRAAAGTNRAITPSAARAAG
jgi:transposase